MTTCVLLADSQPLFCETNRLRNQLASWVRLRCIQQAVYFGASNGDEPAYYELAESFFSEIGISSSRHIQQADVSQLTALTGPAVILLAGGEVDRGWQFLSLPDVSRWLKQRLTDGSILIGISAGAIHLTRGLDQSGLSHAFLGAVAELGSMPLAVAVHEESSGWPTAEVVAADQPLLCIPMREAIFYHQSTLAALTGEAFIQLQARRRQIAMVDLHID